MPILDETQAKALRAELAKPAYEKKSDAECLELVNTPSRIKNHPPTQVPVSIADKRRAMMSLLSVESRAKLLASPMLPRILDHVQSNARVDMAESLGLITGVLITVLEASQLAALLTQTQDDPNHQPFLSGPTPFQSIPGLGDAEFETPEGAVSSGTCTLAMIEEARA